MTDGPPFISDRHALYVGWVLGIALAHGLDAAAIRDDAGNWTDRLTVTVPAEDITVTVVVPPPPGDWTLDVTRLTTSG